MAFLSVHLDMGKAVRVCTGHGKCSRSNCLHQLLRGIQPSAGRFYTIVAEPYPRALCQRIAWVYGDALRRKNERFERYFRGFQPEYFVAVGIQPLLTSVVPALSAKFASRLQTDAVSSTRIPQSQNTNVFERIVVSIKTNSNRVHLSPWD